MHKKDLLTLFEQVQKGVTTPQDGVKRLESFPFENLGFACVDHHRTLRQGFPEVIFGLKKKPQHVAAIVRSLLPQKSNILITRCQPNVVAAVRRVTRKVRYHESAQAATIV